MVKKVDKVEVVSIEVQEQQTLAKYEQRFKALTVEAKGFKIIDDATSKRATELVVELEAIAKQFKAFRDSLVSDTIKQMQKNVMAYEKVVKEVCGDYRTGLRGAKSDYETIKAEAQRKEEERLRLEQQKKYDAQVKKAESKGTIPPPPPPPVSIETPKEQGSSLQDKWTFDPESVDFAKVPEIFSGVRLKALDEKAVNKLIQGGCREIPGIKIYCVKIAKFSNEISL